MTYYPEVAQRYRDKHKEKIKQINHNRYLANKEKIHAKNKAYHDTHKEQNHEYNRLWNASARSEMKKLAVEYLGGKCIRCGFNGHPVALDCHHKDGTTKEHSISSLSVTMDWQKLKAELDKCELLCANCHRIWHLEHSKQE